MNRGQRLWLCSCMLISSVLLPIYFLQWGGFENSPERNARLLIPWGTKAVSVRIVKGADGTLNEFPAEATPQQIADALGISDIPPGFTVESVPGSMTSRLEQIGLYVRAGRDAMAGVLLGFALPIALIFAAGFIALGAKPRG